MSAAITQREEEEEELRRGTWKKEAKGNRGMMRVFVIFSFYLSSLMLASNSDLEENFLPRGHLQPLGSHAPPDNSLIDDLEEVPSPRVFWNKYVKTSRAAVFRGAAKHSNAFKTWTDAYLKENFGNLEVRLEGKKEKSGRIPIGAKGVGRDTIGKAFTWKLLHFVVFSMHNQRTPWVRSVVSF